MLTPFLDFAATAGPVLGTAVVLALLVVPCVIVWLVLKKPHAGRRIEVGVLGKLVTVKVEDSNAERSALPPGTTEAPAQLDGGFQSGRRDQPVNPAQ